MSTGNEGVHRKLLELIEVERPFATGLRLLNEHYAVPLAAKSSPLPEDRYKEVFANLGELVKGHTEFLSELELQLRLWSPLSECGPLAARIPLLVPLHAVFDDNRWIAEDTYGELVRGSSKFSKFVMKAQQGAPEGCPTVQRAYEQSEAIVERLGEFCRELRDLSPESSPDRAKLVTVREDVKERLAKYHSAVRSHDDIERLVKVQQRITDASVHRPFRRFVHHNPLQKVSRKAVQQRMFFLFSDVIVYAKHEGGKKFKSKGAIPLARAWLRDLPDSAKLRNAFQIVATEKTYTVYAEGPDDKREWLRLISKCIHRLETANPQLREERAQVQVSQPQGIAKAFTLDPKEFDPEFGRIDIKEYAEMDGPDGAGAGGIKSPRNMDSGDEGNGDGDNREENDESSDEAADQQAAAEDGKPAEPQGPKARPVRGAGGTAKLRGAVKNVILANRGLKGLVASAKAADAAGGAQEPGAEADAGAEADPASADTLSQLSLGGTATKVEVAPARPAPQKPDGSLIDCVYCSKPIEDGDYICLEERLYLHTPHFACQHCNAQLESAPHVVVGDKVYCRGCYVTLLAAKCSRCGEAIEGKMVRVAGEALHPQCFSCPCGALLNPMTYKVSNKNLKPLCDTCFNGENDYETCGGCDKVVIGGDTVSALGKTYHARCFACDICKAEITDPAFLVLGSGKPAHQGCAKQ